MTFYSCAARFLNQKVACKPVVVVMFMALSHYFNMVILCTFNYLFVPDPALLTTIFHPLAETIITRECLSSLRAVRTDIPADHYEGCRPAAKDVRLAHYVNNSIKELDIKRYAFITVLVRLL
jgi:hypothetical protein